MDGQIWLAFMQGALLQTKTVARVKRSETRGNTIAALPRVTLRVRRETGKE
jgi:hypothetical protein